MVKHIVALSAFVMCLMLVAPTMNVGAAAMKIDESYIGHKQTLSNGMAMKYFNMHVYRQDNISFETVKVSGSYYVGMTASGGGSGYVIYSKSSNDTLIDSDIVTNKQMKFWFISAVEDIIWFVINPNYGPGSAVDFYINRTNASSGDQSSNITALEKSIASLNATMNNLSKSISLINARIDALNNTINSNFLEVSSWINQLNNQITVLMSKLNNLTIVVTSSQGTIFNQLVTLNRLVAGLQENVSRLSIMSNVTTYINTTNNETINVTHYQTNYLYDNKTLNALKNNITENMQTIQELEKTIAYAQNQTGQVAGNITTLQTKVNTINNTRVEKTEIKRFQTITTAEAQSYAIVGALIFVAVFFAMWNAVLMHEIKKLKIDNELERELLENVEEEEEHRHHHRR
jgi:uncharacterized coiled-coil protein SlyX